MKKLALLAAILLSTTCTVLAQTINWPFHAVKEKVCGPGGQDTIIHDMDGSAAILRTDDEFPMMTTIYYFGSTYRLCNLIQYVFHDRALYWRWLKSYADDPAFRKCPQSRDCYLSDVKSIGTLVFWGEENPDDSPVISIAIYRGLNDTSK